jgi:hypothetical protein
LEEEGLAENTIFIFMTDNGATSGRKVFNAGMRGYKESEYDGGHRVPFFIRWPAGNLAQGSDVPDLNAHIDVLPTLADLCGITLPEGLDLDGRSFAQELRDPSVELPGRTLFVETQRTFKPEKWKKTAAMTRDWRLVDNRELYEISEDPGQTKNVINQHPEVVARLRKEFENYWARVTPGDRDLPTPIAGSAKDPELLLAPDQWYLPLVPWHHAATASGEQYAGAWSLRAEKAGRFTFEVRRWPREADAPIAGVPEITKKPDAWSSGGPVRGLIYEEEYEKFRGKCRRGKGSASGSIDAGIFKALPVASVRFRVGDREEVKAVAKTAKSVTFEFDLPETPTEVKGEFLDAAGKVICGTYYVYCRAAGM